MQFSAVEIRFIVTTYLYSTFANDLKRKYFFSKNVYSYRVCSFKDETGLKSKLNASTLILIGSCVRKLVASYLKRGDNSILAKKGIVKYEFQKRCFCSLKHYFFVNYFIF